MARVRRPKVNVRIYARKKAQFAIQENNLDLLEQYARFLTDLNGNTVEKDLILDDLIGSLRTDSMFNEWLEAKSHPISKGGSQ